MGTGTIWVLIYDHMGTGTILVPCRHQMGTGTIWVPCRLYGNRYQMDTTYHYGHMGTDTKYQCEYLYNYP